MATFSLLLPAVLAGVPVAYELDYRALPAPKTNPQYNYTIVISFEGLADLKVPTTIGPNAGPAVAASAFADSLRDDPGWKIRQNDTQLTIYSYGKNRVTKISVLGDGPKPLVRRVILFPANKK